MEILVVLGNRMNDDASLSVEMLKRLDKTIEVESNYDKILCCGGIANKIAGVAEADEMKKYLILHGISENKIIIENRSDTTKENAKFAKAILDELGVKEITLLSSQYHLDRWWLNPLTLFRRYAKVTIKATLKA